ncbi:hypothetical protein BKA83DRAFT_4230056, partial [Pisolithus microcarpus]
VFNFLRGMITLRSTTDATSVPWTLANKYYTADVRFVVGELSTWTPVEEELQRVPAVLFIWSNGQPYRQLAKDLSRQLSHHAFEVALAIRLAPSDERAASDQEDLQDVDAYLSSLGFEFVDAADPVGSDRHGIPGVPRIMDALGTVMWPSMVQRTTRHDSLGYRGHTTSQDTEMRKEFEELEQPTTARDCNAMDPWNTVVTPGHITPHTSSEASSGSRPSTPRSGFDDDFAAFVSASPPSDTATTAPRASPPGSTSFSSTFSFDSATSTPVLEGRTTSYGNGVSYRSLGSVCTSIIEPSEDEDEDKNEDSDVELPSKVEIAETSRRIFGTAPQFQLIDGKPVAEKTKTLALGRFDLQGILNALQGLKEEIGGMADDKQRRKAAARVALGLVYGLDAGGDR